LTASGYISITRPINSLMIGLAVLVGEAVAISTIRLDLGTLTGYLTGVFITAFSMVINDLLDFEVDKANGAKRPLVLGTVTMGGAKALSVALLLAGLATAAYTGLATLAIAAAFSVVATLYNWKLKERGFSGNVAVALSIMIPFIYGGVLAQGIMWNAVLDMMALTAFLAGVGREVIKGIVDVEGDALRDVRSLARSKGQGAAGAVGGAFFLAAVGSSLVPPLLFKTSVFYDVVIGATDLLFVGLAAFVIRSNGKEDARRAKTLALLGMFTGMVGFILQGLLGGTF
jgi:geranylgeranylglycerol-phosphate geranylgeranyltransferase